MAKDKENLNSEDQYLSDLHFELTKIDKEIAEWKGKINIKNAQLLEIQEEIRKLKEGTNQNLTRLQKDRERVSKIISTIRNKA